MFSEYDYAMQEPRVTLGQPLRECRLYMVADQRYKLMHAVGYRPMLFDLEADPHELVDLGGDSRPDGETCALSCARRCSNGRSRDHNRITMSGRRGSNGVRPGDRSSRIGHPDRLLG